MSASKIAALLFKFLFMLWARFKATVDLPTPPLQEYTAIMFFMWDKVFLVEAF